MSLINEIAGEFGTVGRGLKRFHKKSRRFQAKARRSPVVRYGTTFSRETIKGVIGDDFVPYSARNKRRR